MNLNDKMNLYFQDVGVGFVVVVMIVIVFGYIFRFVVGFYDNEGIVIFCMLLIYVLWIKFVKIGLFFWFCLCVLVYFYMVILFCKFFKGLNFYVLLCVFIFNIFYFFSVFVF